MSEQLKRPLFAMLLTLSLVLAACGASPPRITVEAVLFDFGDVKLGDVVTRELAVNNAGSGTLVIESVATSCGCTTASVDQTQIAAGESTVLHIAFDSAAHGDVAGFYTRQVYLATNDPEQPEIRVEFTANVVREEGN